MMVARAIYEALGPRVDSPVCNLLTVQAWKLKFSPQNSGEKLKVAAETGDL